MVDTAAIGEPCRALARAQAFPQAVKCLRGGHPDVYRLDVSNYCLVAFHGERLAVIVDQVQNFVGVGGQFSFADYSHMRKPTSVGLRHNSRTGDRPMKRVRRRERALFGRDAAGICECKDLLAAQLLARSIIRYQ